MQNIEDAEDELLMAEDEEALIPYPFDSRVQLCVSLNVNLISVHY